MMDVTMNACYTCSYYNFKECFCEKYLKGKEKAVFLCPDCKSRPSAQPNTPTDTPTDFISRQAAIDFIDAGHHVNPNEPRWSDNEVVNFLKSRPSAQRTGHWINKKSRWIASISMNVHDAYECSNCGEPGVSWWKYCINCGARMEIEEWKIPIIERWRNDGN